MNKQLSKNFWLCEFTKSQTATRLGIYNEPTEEEVEKLRLLCSNVIQPVRDHFGITTINSGYRGEILNRRIGGSRTSQHCKGEAADFECPTYPTYDVARWIQDHLDFDQLILEFFTPGIPSSGWVHCSYKNREKNRNQVLTAVRDNKRTIYKLGLIV